MTDLHAMLLAQEGLRLLPYLDTQGNWTIGVGRNLTDKGIDQHEAMLLLNRDCADAIEDVQHVCSIYDHLSRPRQLVLISLAFNVGRARLAKFVRFLGAIHREDWEDAAAELLDSKAATQAPGRYTALAHMMRTNESEWV